jgi:hypothetical protein
MTITARQGLADYRMDTRPPVGAPHRFKVARTIGEIAASWRMVYEVYLRSGLIHPNPYAVHTTRHHASANTAVFQSVRGTAVEATLTAVVDGPLGLPMDNVYQHELDALRRKGRRITEYGLFAHVRQLGEDASDSAAPESMPSSSRVQASVIHLMRLAFYFALANNSADFIVGVHPRHARFYTRAFGFLQIGQIRTCPTVNHRPVVLLHANLQRSLGIHPLPHALDYCLNHPVESDLFAERFGFHPRELALSPTGIGGYLSEKEARAAAAQLSAG